MWERVAGSPRAPAPAISSVGIVSQKTHPPCAGCTGAFHVSQGLGQGPWDVQGRWDAQTLGLSQPLWEHQIQQAGLQPTTSSTALTAQHRAAGAGGQGRHSLGSFLKMLHIFKEGGLCLNSGFRNTKPKQD